MTDMAWGNKFFEFDSPVRWFKAVGLSNSNTYIGSSRAIDTVHEQILANKGDVMHALVGGLFLVRKDGTVETGKLRLPKPLLEKTYGMRETDAELLGRMAAQGHCHEVPAPTGKIDYALARQNSTLTRFPDCTGSVTPTGHVESPALVALSAAAEASGLEEAIKAAGGTVRKYDIGLTGDPDSMDCLIQAKLGEGRLASIRASTIDGRIMLSESAGMGFMDALKGVGNEPLGLNGDHRTATISLFPAGDAEPLMRALANYAENGHVAAPDAPAP